MNVSMMRVAIAACAALTAAAPLKGESFTCPGGHFVIENAGDTAGRICEIAARASEQLASCGLEVPSPLTIAVADELVDRCFGLYHCGEGRVEILPPETYETLRAEGKAPAFAPISPDAFYESVIRHELTHAALDSMPCPFDSCVASQEYVAYAMQVRFLPEDDLRAFEAAIDVEGRVPRDSLSAVILMMAPDVFTQRAWLHFTQRDDPCAFVGQIARGEVLLDYERP